MLQLIYSTYDSELFLTQYLRIYDNLLWSQWTITSTDNILPFCSHLNIDEILQIESNSLTDKDFELLFLSMSNAT